jgi:mono/diheme cytochrome c family protein
MNRLWLVRKARKFWPPNRGWTGGFLHFLAPRPAALALFALFPICAGALQASEVSADSERGAQVFELQGCNSCHAVNGAGPAIGPDLGRLADQGFTPASFAATLWNHAPAMWTEMRLRDVAHPAMDEQQAADLFAFFYSLRFFEQPGDAGRGKALFATLKCAECHGLVTAKLAGAKPVKEWTVPGDPLSLVETMWNHSSAMHAEMTRQKITLPQLTGQQLADLLVYVRSAQGLARSKAMFQSASAEEGKGLFDSKGCSGCHGAETRFFSIGLRDETITDIAADMWNHGLDMRLKNQVFEPGQMRAIAAYIWSRRTFESEGSPGAGHKVFTAKKCTVCHDDAASGAPPLTAASPSDGSRHVSAATMVSGLTRHGPAMLDRMREKHLAWPHFSAEEMADLIAYLNTRSARNGR